MEDCCAVCAEPLEWVGYGPCGHREVCFTCIARLRFVLNDKHCCICKQLCPTVYVTKALGDYTKVVTDWKSLLSHSNSSGQGNLLYDNVVEAYFDDEEPFKIIKAMCRLYCSICEKAVEGESVAKGMMKKGYTFKNIDTLRRHQSTVHKVFMCELCLEGRKVFICEQKLYSKSQLDQHSRRGDSEVDGNEEERGGFAGHPMCDFCRQPFYGDNELYQHMSQEHYTCHICQRARPGHYEYYRNYDDLEAHFRQEHLLCENPECLAKKFVVFPSEAELKRHNATTHGGHMSRSQRNAALQIPVSFHYRRPGQDSSDDNSGGYSSRRGGRSRGGHPYTSNARNDQLGAAVLASVESANIENAVRESLVISPSTNESATTDNQGALERPNIDHPEGVTSQIQGDADSEPSRYLAAVWGAGPSAFGDAAFPPLPGTSKSARRRAKLKNQGPASMAALLGGNGTGGTARTGIRVLNAADNRSSPGPSREFETAQTHQGLNSISRNDSMGPAQSRNSVTAIQPSPVTIQREPVGGPSNIRNGTPSREMGALGNQQGNHLVNLSLEDIRAANKALVERIRAGLEGNEQRFADFKEVSSLFRKGEMSSKDYHVHIARLGLSYVVPELARLCPDPRKGKELLDLHAAQLTNNVVDRRSLLPGLAGAFSSSSSLAVPQPVKGTGSDSGSSASGSGFSDFSARSNVSLGTSSRADPSDGVVEVLSTDGYRRQKGKSKSTDTGSSSSGVRVDVMPSAEGTLLNELAAARDRTPQVLVRAFPPLLPESSQTHVPDKPSAMLEEGWSCGLCTRVNSAGAILCAACGTTKPGEEAKSGADSVGSDRKKKKSPKFQRVRLGDGSASALLDSAPSNPWGRTEVENDSKNSGRLQGRGVWNNGGGQRLVSLAQRDAIINEAWNRGR
ncbi:unnamed protein product [Calypogeia fissa]